MLYEVITTDVAISTEMLQKALSKITKTTFNRLSIDGDTSTNDMVSLMASGLAGNSEITSESSQYEIFEKALYIVMMNLTKMLAKDGEGATVITSYSIHYTKLYDFQQEISS